MDIFFFPQKHIQIFLGKCSLSHRQQGNSNMLLNPSCHAGMAWMTHSIRVWIIRISLPKAFSWRSLPPSPGCIILPYQHCDFANFSCFLLMSRIYCTMNCLHKNIYQSTRDNEAFSQSKSKHKASCEQYPSCFLFDAPSILKGIQEHFHTSRSTAVK